MLCCDLDNQYSRLQRKRKIFAIIALGLIALSLLFSSSIVFAADCNCDAVSGTHEKGKTFPCTEGWNPINKSAYDSKKIGYVMNPLSYSENFTVNFTSGTYRGVWGTIGRAYDSIKVIGILIVFVYFMMEIIESTTKETFTIEHLIKLTIKLFQNLCGRIKMRDNYSTNSYK